MKNFIVLLSLIFAFNLNANTDPNNFETLKQLEGNGSEHWKEQMSHQIV